MGPTLVQSAYLYLNAALYAGFAAWCTLSAAKTSENLGYLALSQGGRSEYLVIYGGLQWGLAAMFYLLAGHADLRRTGLAFAVSLYTPIVVYRVVTVVRYWPVAPLTLATGCLELGLLVAGALFFAGTKSMTLP
jgi:hypothetical protein